MSFTLSSSVKNNKSLYQKLKEGSKTFGQYLEGEKFKIIVVVLAVLINSSSSVITPYLISYTIDNYILKKNLTGLFSILWVLLGVYILSFIAGYLQARVMGRLSQRTLFKLRNNLFAKIQSLPIAFFNQNKSGDLISRLNNDTDKLNQFLSESLLRFVSIFFSVVGIGIFIFFINVPMAIVTLGSTIILVIATLLLSKWVEKVNKESLETSGEFSAQIQESLTNFKAVVAFNKQDYFENKINEVNQKNFKRTVLAQVSSGLFNPIYNLSGNIAQILVLAFGIYLVSKNQLSIGLLIGFIAYTQKFYEPLRILGTIWGSLQGALAAWVRVQEIFGLESNLKVVLIDK